MIKIDSYTVGSGEPTVVLYYLANPSTGADNIVISSSSGYNTRCSCLLYWSKSNRNTR